MSQQLNQLGAELQRLVVYEDECQRKDNFITQLKEEIGDLHSRLRQAHAAVAPVVASDPEVTQKLLMLENEVTARKIEVNNLKEQVYIISETILHLVLGNTGALTYIQL